MAVPSHDQRDFEYAIAHNIDMIQVIEGRDVSECAFEKQDYLGKGCKLINSRQSYLFQIRCAEHHPPGEGFHCLLIL